MELELVKFIVYDFCNFEEIQRKLNEQQEFQRDIEKYSIGVVFVFNLCEVLLYDCDVCVIDVECDFIQQVICNLDWWWRNICVMFMERRFKIEEMW